MAELSVSVTNLVIVPEAQNERNCCVLSQCHVVCADWLCSSHKLRWKPAIFFLCTEFIGPLIGLCKVQHTTQFFAGTVSSAQALKAYVTTSTCLITDGRHVGFIFAWQKKVCTERLTELTLCCKQWQLVATYCCCKMHNLWCICARTTFCVVQVYWKFTAVSVMFVILI